MSATDQIIVHVPARLAAESGAVLQRLGLSTDDAVRLFLSQVTLHRGLPFPLTLPPAPETDDSDLLAPIETRQAVLDSFYDDTTAR